VRLKPIALRTLRFDIRDSSFCHQMVRSVVATLVEVWRGRDNAGVMGRPSAVSPRGTAEPAPPRASAWSRSSTAPK
jgi:tRNA pseudouridine38-40 synthase